MNSFNDLSSVETTSATPEEIGVILQLADGTGASLLPGAIAACNAAAEKLLGMTTKQIQGWTSTNFPWQTIHPDGTHFPGEQHPAMVALSTGEPCYNVPMGFYQPDGNLVWLNIDAEPLFRRGDSTPYAVSVSVTRLPSETEPPKAPDQKLQTVEITPAQQRAGKEFPKHLSPDEQHWYSLFQSLPIGVVLVDPTTAKIVEFNDTAATNLGYTREEFAQLTLCDIDSLLERETILKICRSFTENSDQVSFRTQHRTKLGHYRDVMVLGQPVEINGQWFVYGIWIDITEQRHTESALHENSSRLELVQQATQSGIWDWVFATNTARISQQYCRVMGLDPNLRTLAYEQWLELVHPSDRDWVSERVAEAIQHARDYSVQYRILHPDGVRWIDSRGQVYYNDDRQPVHMLGYVQDITDRKQAEADLQQLTANLRDSTTQLTVAIEAAQFGTWEVDLTVQPYVAYPRSLRHDQIYGYESLHPNWDYDTFISHIHPDDRALIAEKFQQTVTTGEAWSVECRIIRADQTEGWIWIRGSVYEDETRGTRRLIGLIADISDRKTVEAALQQSEDRYRMAVTSAKLGTWDWDLITNELKWDTGCKALFGLSPDAPSSIDVFFSGLHPDDRDRVSTIVQTALNPASGGAYDTEYRTIGIEDGIERWVAAKGQVYFSSTGQPLRFIGTVLDITDVKRQEAERQQTQTQLRDRQERLEAALFASETGTFRWNIQTNELDWDENLDRLFGLPPGQTARSLEAFIQLVHPDDRQGVIDRCNRCATEGADFDMDFRAVYPDGSIHWLSDKGKVFFDADGKPAYMSGACVNITDRKRIEAELQQKNAILNVINESTPTPIFVKDRKGKYIFANPATLAALGKPIDQVIGYRDDEIHPEFGKALMEVDRRVMATGQTEIAEEQVGDCTFLSVKVPYRDATGAVIGLIGVANNISDRVQVERDRERVLQQEQAAREASDRANRIKDEFLAVLSHELRSPLNPILGWSKMLKTGRLNAAKTQEAVSIIERNAQLQAQLIEDLLDISRILQGKLTLNREPVNLEFVITSAQEMVRLAAAAKAITITTDFEPSIGQVLGDAGRLQQVVWNLLTNAVKFTPESGQVTVRLARIGSQAQIQVIDTGKGISPEFLPHVFERFRQADSSTTRKFGGLGLGLAIVRQLVELHGGTIIAESQGEDQGSTFTVLLPLLAPIDEQFTEMNDAAASDCTTDCPLSGYQILVVDDESDSREIVAFVLEQGGAIVTQAASAAQALALLSRDRFDALVSDIGMPEMNGYALIQQVRAKPPEQGGQIPALALTAYAGEINVQQAMQAGFERHLAKPIDPDELIAVVISLTQISH